MSRQSAQPEGFGPRAKSVVKVENVSLERHSPPQVWSVVCLVYVLVILWVVKVNRASAAV